MGQLVSQAWLLYLFFYTANRKLSLQLFSVSDLVKICQELWIRQINAVFPFFPQETTSIVSRQSRLSGRTMYEPTHQVFVTSCQLQTSTECVMFWNYRYTFTTVSNSTVAYGDFLWRFFCGAGLTLVTGKQEGRSRWKEYCFPKLRALSSVMNAGDLHFVLSDVLIQAHFSIFVLIRSTHF